MSHNSSVTVRPSITTSDTPEINSAVSIISGSNRAFSVKRSTLLCHFNQARVVNEAKVSATQVTWTKNTVSSDGNQITPACLAMKTVFADNSSEQVHL